MAGLTITPSRRGRDKKAAQQALSILFSGGHGATGVTDHSQLTGVATTDNYISASPAVHLTPAVAKSLLALLGVTSTEDNALTILATLRAQLAEIANLRVDDLRVAAGIAAKDYAAGNNGWRGDARGDFELNSLRLREFLEVPELRYNRISVWLGVDFSSPGGGIIERVDTATQTVYLKLEEGELGTVAVDDLCFGIYHALDAATEDSDDGRGNMTVAGFATAYFKVDAVASDLRSFTYSLRPGYTVHPQPFMHFAVRGNVTNTDRQRFKYSTRSYERYLAGVNDWEWRGSNIAAQLGDLSNLGVFGLQMEGYSAYLNNVYFHGTIQELPDAINDQIMQLIGTGNIRCIVESTHGNEFGDIGWRTDMRASVVMGVYGLIDKTDEVTSWRWERISGDGPDDINSDLLWNEEHKFHDSREITVEVGKDIPLYSKQCTFRVSAEIPGRTTLEGRYEIDLRA